MGISNFSNSLKIGKTSELYAEQWFNKHGYNYTNVSDVKEYQEIDVDYIVDGLGLCEIKKNLHEAAKGPSGKFFWVEVKVGDKPGWWYKTEADFFLFLDSKNEKMIAIQNSKIFKDFVNKKIETAEHSDDSCYRYDYKKDYRYNYVITAVSMRVYLSELKNNQIPCRTYTLIS
jgi:hypothetical protein